MKELQRKISDEDQKIRRDRQAVLLHELERIQIGRPLPGLALAAPEGGEMADAARKGLSTTTCPEQIA